jgi:hypothetical protein
VIASLLGSSTDDLVVGDLPISDSGGSEYTKHKFDHTRSDEVKLLADGIDRYLGISRVTIALHKT